MAARLLRKALTNVAVNDGPWQCGTAVSPPAIVAVGAALQHHRRHLHDRRRHAPPLRGTCGRDQVSRKKPTSPRAAFNRRTPYRRSEKPPTSSPRLASPQIWGWRCPEDETGTGAASSPARHRAARRRRRSCAGRGRSSSRRGTAASGQAMASIRSARRWCWVSAKTALGCNGLRTGLGRPERCKLARVLQWERNDEGLKLSHRPN